MAVTYKDALFALPSQIWSALVYLFSLGKNVQVFKVLSFVLGFSLILVFCAWNKVDRHPDLPKEVKLSFEKWSLYVAIVGSIILLYTLTKYATLEEELAHKAQTEKIKVSAVSG